jgi:hypothetical protein
MTQIKFNRRSIITDNDVIKIIDNQVYKVLSGGGISVGGGIISDGSVSLTSSWSSEFTKLYVDGSLALRDTSIAWLNTNKAAASHSHTLNSLTDVIVDTANPDDFLKWDGSNWVPQAGTSGATSLSG